MLYRGGARKAPGVHAGDLPFGNPLHLKQRLLAVNGSPGHRQIGGVGGGVLTIKFAQVAPSARSDADLDHSFVQAGADRAAVSYELLGGDISSCARLWTIEEGLVRARGPETVVRASNTNTNGVFIITAQVEDGKPLRFGRDDAKAAVRDPRTGGLRITEEPVPDSEVVVHDEHSDDPSYAFALSRLSGSALRNTPIGVFRSVQRPAYDDLVRAQVNRVVESTPDDPVGQLNRLLHGNDTWVVA